MIVSTHTHTQKKHFFSLSRCFINALLYTGFGFCHLYCHNSCWFFLYVFAIIPLCFLAVAAFGLGWSVDFFHRCLLYPHAVSILHTQLRLHINTGSCLIIDLEYLTILYDGKHWIIYEYLVCQLILFEWQ